MIDRFDLYKRWSQHLSLLDEENRNEPVATTLDDKGLQRELRSFAELPDNWNGEGANPASYQAVSDAIEFLSRRPAKIPIPSPDIGSSGEVGVYWDECGVFAEAVFDGDGYFHYYAEHVVDGSVRATSGKDGLVVGEDWPEGLLGLLSNLAS